MLAQTERDEFLAVVCADADWLRAEFDAIVKAGWEQPPAVPERPRRPVAVPVPGTGAGWRDRALVPGRPVPAFPARERSPPGPLSVGGTPERGG
jgi:hypothetical protein